jgi:hypothetical protein
MPNLTGQGRNYFKVYYRKGTMWFVVGGRINPTEFKEYNQAESVRNAFEVQGTLAFIVKVKEIETDNGEWLVAAHEITE